MSRLLDLVKEEGFIVKVSHRRPMVGMPFGFITLHELRSRQKDWHENTLPRDLRRTYPQFDLYGGETSVRLLHESEPPDTPPHLGLAFCSFSDPFNRRTGLELALKRALQHAGRGDLIARCYAS